MQEDGIRLPDLNDPEVVSIFGTLKEYAEKNGLHLDPESLTMPKEIVSNNPYANEIHFSDQKQKEVGVLSFVDDKITFSGNADESAMVFFESLINHHSEVIKNIREENKALRELVAAIAGECILPHELNVAYQNFLKNTDQSPTLI
jgi:hypothetical protein